MNKILSYAFLILCLQTVPAQNKWFTVYQDSVALVKDATKIAEKFKKDVSKFKKDEKFTTTTILNTTPYLIHEYGHAYQEIYDFDNSKVSYQNEHLANTIAMLYWRKIGKTKELDEYYELAKKMFKKLPNPVPAGENKEDYFTKNYEAAASNPFVYAYMQFGQFIAIYEDKNLPEFDVFMKTTFK
jgi:hypothetical protein